MESVYEANRTPINYIEVWNSDTMCDPHYHQSVEILIASEGSVNATVNNDSRVLDRGEICVADCFDVHSFDSHGAKSYIIIIPKEFLSDYLAVKGKKHIATPFITDKTTCAKIADCAKALMDSDNSRLTQLGYVNTIMGLICETCGLSEYSDANIAVMQTVLDYLEENSSDDVNLESLAAHFGYSKYYFSRLFNKFFKFNLNEYLARLRIRNFISAMKFDPNADIISAALACGFNSQQTFYRCFTKYYGIPPKAYIKQLKKRDGN